MQLTAFLALVCGVLGMSRVSLYVISLCSCRGLYLYARTLGPFYRIVIRDKDENGKVMAVSSGFTVPAMGLMHCDSLEIFTRG